MKDDYHDTFDARSLLTEHERLLVAESRPTEAPQPMLKRARTRTPMDEAQVVMRQWKKVAMAIDGMDEPEAGYCIGRIKMDLNELSGTTE